MTTLTFVTPASTLVVPIGAAGSGKSTLLNQVAASLRDPGFRFGNDDVRRTVCGGKFVMDTSSKVSLAARSMVAARLAHGLPAALDCTNHNEKARADALTLANEAGVRTLALLCVAPLDVVLARNAARTEELQVPEFIVTSMYESVHALTPQDLLDAGFDEVHVFDENVTELVIEFVS